MARFGPQGHKQKQQKSIIPNSQYQEFQLYDGRRRLRKCEICSTYNEHRF